MNNYFKKKGVTIIAGTLFFMLSLISNSLHSQSNTFAVNYNEASPKEIFTDIELKTPYRFLYDSHTKVNKGAITLKKEKTNINGLLKEIEKKTRLTFQKTGSNIAVSQITPFREKPGIISGKVVGEFGESLFGVVIKIEPGNHQTYTDATGDFSIDLPPGNYVVNFSYYEGYEKKNLENVPVISGENTTLNIVLKNVDIALDDIVITATYKKSAASTEGLLVQQKKAIQFSNGISAEQIAQTPDGDVGATLKRITGVTTVDNKYVVVRSMGDRWNQAAMDGINLPSTSAYQNQFSFNLIPTSMVESIVVSKTATPDMNANFAGGYVEVKTKDIPRENFNSVSIGTGYNTRSTFNTQITKQQGKYDFFGFDEGTRDYPTGMDPIYHGDLNQEGNREKFVDQSKRFTQDNFTNYKANTPVNLSFGIALGRKYQLKNNNKWGFVGAFSLKNTYRQTQIDHSERGSFLQNTSFLDPKVDENGEIVEDYMFTQHDFKNSGTIYKNKATLSTMFNTGIQWGKHRLTTRNAYVNMFTNTLSEIASWNKYSVGVENVLNGDLPTIGYKNYPEFQRFMQNKLEGNHKFNKSIEANWFVARTQLNRDIKDATLFDYFPTRSQNTYKLNLEQTGKGGGFRQYFYNKEIDYNWGFDIAWRFETGKLSNRIKAGYFGSTQHNINRNEQAGLGLANPPSGTGLYSTTVPFSKLLNESNYNTSELGIGWFIFAYAGGKQFEAKAKKHAPYIMLDNKFNNWLRLVWGVRAESYDYTQISVQQGTSTGPNANELELSLDELTALGEKSWIFMPSINLTVSPTKTTNIRLAYSESILRPQFAERLQSDNFDPERNAIITSNEFGVKSSLTKNYDLKWEWYPSLGETLSAGVYYKDIDKPIEGINAENPSGENFVKILNSIRAKLWGVEVEFSKNLSFLGNSEILKNLFITANGTLNETTVWSVKNLTAENSLIEYKTDRPLYGQSPYAYNLGLDYTGERLGVNIRYNGNGDQYLLVGYNYSDEEIQMPYQTTEAQISYKFLKDKNLQLKLKIRNMFDTPYEIYNNLNTYSVRKPGDPDDNPRDYVTRLPGTTDKYDVNIDRKLYKAFFGAEFGLSLKYNF